MNPANLAVESMAAAAAIMLEVPRRTAVSTFERSAAFGPPPRRRAMYRAALFVAFAWAFALLNILSGPS